MSFNSSTLRLCLDVLSLTVLVILYVALSSVTWCKTYFRNLRCAFSTFIFSIWYDLIMFSICDADCHKSWDTILFMYSVCFRILSRPSSSLCSEMKRTLYRKSYFSITSMLYLESWKTHCRILGCLHRSDRLIRGSRVNFRVYKAVKMPRIVAFVLCHLGSKRRKDNQD